MRISDWSSDVCSSDLNAVLTLTARKHLENALVNALRIAPYQATGILARHDNFHELDYLASPLPGTKALICEAHGPKTATAHQIGRASCRERVCQYVSFSVIADSLKKRSRSIIA